MKILVINGPNLNMLGVREKEIYGDKTYKALVAYIKKAGKIAGVKTAVCQFNEEGKIVTAIQRAYKRFDGIVINAAAYTHTSIAIRDALKAVNLPTVEVHLTDIYEREDFRRRSFIADVSVEQIVGKGFDGYKMAIESLVKYLSKN